MPVIKWMEKKLPKPGRQMALKRILLIALFFLIIIAVIVVSSYYVFQSIILVFKTFLEKAPDYSASALLVIGEWISKLRDVLPPLMQGQLDQLLCNLGDTLGQAVNNLFMTGISLIPSSFGLIFALASTPIFLFYLLKDWEKIGKRFYSSLPKWWADHVRGITGVIEEVLGRYSRATVTLGIIVGVADYIGLTIIGVQFAPVLGAIAGATEMIPTPEKALWVILLFLGVQLLENSFLVPKIQGSYLRINPGIIVLLLVLAGYFMGFWGLILAVPLAATIIGIYKYVRHRIIIDDDYFHQDNSSRLIRS